MDNYQRLFNEARPQKTDRLFLPNQVDVKKMIDSEWLQDLLNGVTFYQRKEYQTAIKYLDRAIQQKSDNHHLYEVRANIKEDSSDILGAINDYKKSLYISGSDWYATYNQIAINFLNIKDFNRALIAFDIAIELKDDLKNRGIDENTMPYFMDGVVTRVDLERIYSNRANTKLSLLDYKGCGDDCIRAIEINPEYSNSYFVFGLMFLAVEQYDNAYKVFKAAESKGHQQASLILQQFS